MRRDDQRQAVKNIPLEQLKPFKNHPFQVRDDEEFRRLVESIEIHGVIHPAVARQIGEECYELISGHRRKAACEVLGYSEMPVLVRSMTDDEAVVNMVDANLQRETILPSERAFAYKMKLAAMSHQGRKGVLTLIADMLRVIAEYSKNDRAEFIRTVQETQAAQQTADISKKRKRLASVQKRAGELERLICKIYEDNALGKLPDARYEALDAQYAKEQDALNEEITELEKAVSGYDQSRKSAEKFIALIDKYENFDTLTNTMLNEFVEKILVHERARKGSQDTTQEVEIYFNFVGRYIPPALQPVPLTPEEQEELRKKEERKDRLHQNYLRRKANGKQKEWEERYNAKRKAQREAAKAAIRAEDMEKGIFTTVSQLPRQEPRKATLPASAAV